MSDELQHRHHELRTGLIRVIAAYDREIAHPEIYEDLRDE